MSNTDNPYIDEDSLQSTVYNAVNAFAVLELVLAEDPEEEGISFNLEQYTGLQRIIAGAKSALNYAADQIDEVETEQRKTTERALSKDFALLSPEQRESIEYLVSDIAHGNVNRLNVATRDSARIVLARFEAESESMSAEECAQELRRGEFDVAFEMTPEPHSGDLDGYIVSHLWTLKGLRHVLARERFFESITCNVEVDS